jgi:ligand-binding sensor domain-containing protein
MRLNFAFTKILRILLYCFVVFFTSVLNAQYPFSFDYNDENGLPSNEVYSIVQDKRGFIWIGSDAGLCKFDGVRYTNYLCSTQSSKAISGLTLSSSGRLYCYNFKSQVFYIEQDQLKELKGTPPPFITNLSADQYGKLYISYSGGVDVFNEITGTWKKYGKRNEKLIREANSYVAKTCRPSADGRVFALKSNGIETFQNHKVQLDRISIFKGQSPGLFLLEHHRNKLWIVSIENNIVYQYFNHTIRELKNSNLSRMLSNRKITNVKSLPDGYLWISTYKGMIRYDSKKDIPELYYPDYAFSDVLIDREANYWFTTIGAGILRVSNIQMPVWSKVALQSETDKVSKIAQGSGAVYFATMNGTIGKIEKLTEKVTIYYTGENGDVQSFDYDPITEKLWFNINNKLFCVHKNSVKQIQGKTVSAIKKIKEIGGDYFIGSSNGLYINNQLYSANHWIRDILGIGENLSWIATDTGLLLLKKHKKKWDTAARLLPDVQILSMDVDLQNRFLFTLTFEGKIHRFSPEGKCVQLTRLPNQVQGYKLKYSKYIIYVATNKGLWIFDIVKCKWSFVNKLKGLASDNIRDLVVSNQTIWLGTGKGVQKVPINSSKNGKLGLVYLKKIRCGKNDYEITDKVELNYDESIFLFPEVVLYSSGGDFSYAYRIKSANSSWIRLPGTMDEIEIQNIPIGEFKLELKVIDHENRDSENSIILKGNVLPPFWKSNWFLIGCFLCVTGIFYLIFRRRVKGIRLKQQQEIERINLENDLRLSNESVLKSQMNPHFVFNVLNSIKLYIYKNDKQNASQYLTDFSNLIRTFLEVSNRADLSLSEEFEMLKLYIDLEAMLIHHDFTFDLVIDPTIDVKNTFIPSLILQPFIENAFKHGLHHKKGAKNLKIVITKLSGRCIQVEIIDNGIGRKAAFERKLKGLEHKSFATTAIEKRINLLNRNETMISIDYEDLYENERSLGTNVIIKLAVDE